MVYTKMLMIMSKLLCLFRHFIGYCTTALLSRFTNCLSSPLIYTTSISKCDALQQEIPQLCGIRFLSAL